MKRILSYSAVIIELRLDRIQRFRSDHGKRAVLRNTVVGPTTARSSTRFIVLANWDSAAVLDRETGLVWEKAPSTFDYDWNNASFHCISLNAGRMSRRVLNGEVVAAPVFHCCQTH